MSKEFKLPPLDPVLAARLSRGTLFAGNEVEDALRDYATRAVEAALAERQGEAVAWTDEIIDDLHALHDSEMIQETDSGDALIRLDAAVAAVEEAKERHTATHPAPAQQPLSKEQERAEFEAWAKTARLDGEWAGLNLDLSEFSRDSRYQYHETRLALLAYRAGRAHGIGGEKP